MRGPLAYRLGRRVTNWGQLRPSWSRPVRSLSGYLSASPVSASFRDVTGTVYRPSPGPVHTPLGEILARAMYDNLNRFIVPSLAGPARLVPLAVLVDKELSLTALRQAAHVAASMQSRGRTACGAAAVRPSRITGERDSADVQPKWVKP